ncbi:MAG: ATP-binding protein [Planctomycetales bacterium 71-10]|nr:MAG: ATP-binding protein [Planctomycetales bacterium 71-10]
MTSHIAAFGLRKSYRKGKIEVPVLGGVDVDAARGEFVTVMGASGSGKSTMLHLLGLLDQPDAGQVVLDGRRIDDRPDRERDRLRNRTFGFIFQFYHLLPELSAVENVMMPHLIREGVFSYIRKRKQIRRDAEELLDRVGLGHRMAHQPSEMSGGEIQRAAIARALVARPEVLLADEPTGNLDSSTGQGVLDLLRDLNRERGLTMILVTHDQQIAHQADRVVRLSEGRIEEWVPALV